MFGNLSTSTRDCDRFKARWIYTSIKGDLTFLEWTVILIIGIYLTTEVILWINYLK